ncbi:MAG: sigma-54 interaction domain-containing protein [Vicinamibacterales bacterium]
MTETNDLFRGYFNAATDSMLIVSAADRRIIDVNAGTMAETGYSRSELVGMTLERVLRAAGGQVTRSLEGSVGAIEGATLLTRTGASIVVDAKMTPVRANTEQYFFVAIRTRGTESSPVRAAADALRCSGGRECEDIIGRSERVRQVCRLIGSVAASDATVLIQGESGTGKEVAANAIHVQSRRRRGPFVRVNCAALPDALLESELFGHVKGAFTGATRDRRGRFKQADGGTILLDEIGSMPLSGQATLLRVLQEREFEPVGSSQSVSVDVRVIAATNVDLEKSVAAGTFRADLYYRLNVFGITLPPLRERPEDVPLLAQHFLRHCSETLRKQLRSLAPDTLSALCAYTWPGNVRELENAIEHATIVETGSMVLPASLPANIRGMGVESSDDSGCALGLRERLTLAERQILLDTLRRSNGIKKRAAEMLGIDSRNMPYFLRKHRLQDGLNGF